MAFHSPRLLEVHSLGPPASAGAAGFTDVAVYARGNALTVACYKVMALFLPLLLPQLESLWREFAIRCVGLLTLPTVILLAAIANISLRSQGGDDCLGYTAVSVRPVDLAKNETK